MVCPTEEAFAGSAAAKVGVLVDGELDLVDDPREALLVALPLFSLQAHSIGRIASRFERRHVHLHKRIV